MLMWRGAPLAFSLLHGVEVLPRQDSAHASATEFCNPARLIRSRYAQKIQHTEHGNNTFMQCGGRKISVLMLCNVLLNRWPTLDTQRVWS
jgi:hypothetical protein